MSFQAFGPLNPWRPQVHMTLTWTHSVLKPPGPRTQELLGHIKKGWQVKMLAVFFFPQPSSCSLLLYYSKLSSLPISSLMKRVLNFMRNPKLAHILVYDVSHNRLCFNKVASVIYDVSHNRLCFNKVASVICSKWIVIPPSRQLGWVWFFFFSF